MTLKYIPNLLFVNKYNVKINFKKISINKCIINVIDKLKHFKTLCKLNFIIFVS